MISEDQPMFKCASFALKIPCTIHLRWLAGWDEVSLPDDGLLFRPEEALYPATPLLINVLFWRTLPKGLQAVVGDWEQFVNTASTCVGQDTAIKKGDKNDGTGRPSLEEDYNSRWGWQKSTTVGGD
ncbi:hypothetical protein TELCIR_21296 [Teladorsagia circumcincta]|uniref:Uncharacterized protein n=1 Tax=Teladorsagia circumcincta TaxID=45464 RepID=A0A2G9TH61_TELCI|nr:hypothetical protein TELCIR_21296 [Teladorsagia circumcincta]